MRQPRYLPAKAHAWLVKRSTARQARRASAALALSVTAKQTTAGLPALIRALSDPDLEVAATAGQTLARMGRPAVPDLALVLRVTNQLASARIAALTALVHIGREAGPATPELTSLLSDPDSRTTQLAIEALSRIGRPAVPSLALALRSANLQVRTNALLALAHAGSAAAEAIPQMLQMVSTDDQKALVLSVVANVLPMSQPARVALAEALQDQPTDVRLIAVQGLGRAGKDAAAVLPKLIDVLARDPEEKVRGYAALALAACGERGFPARTALSNALRDDSEFVRTSARYALNKIPESP